MCVFVCVCEERPGSSTAALACGGCAAVMRFEDEKSRDDGRLRPFTDRFAK